MRRPSYWLAILMGGASALVSVCFAQVSENVAQAPQPVFAVSFMPGSRDDAGRFMGGTEMRVLSAHAGRLYAGNGYWEDQPGPEGPQGAQILVLDRRVRGGGSITTSTSAWRMVARAISPSRRSKRSLSRPTATACTGVVADRGELGSDRDGPSVQPR